MGRPKPENERNDADWACPVFIQGFTPHIVDAAGAGPVDSLMNAMTLVRQFFDANKDRFTEEFNQASTRRE